MRLSVRGYCAPDTFPPSNLVHTQVLPACSMPRRYDRAVRVFLAGASGVIGVRLVSLLVSAGHDVAAMTRTPGKAETLASLGAVPVVCDVFDAAALTDAVVAFRPDVILDELTDLPDDQAHIRNLTRANARIRTEGTRHLLSAARAAGARGFVSQSVGWELEGEAGVAVREHETMVLAAGGVVVRYGQFYGPGTYHESDLPRPPRIHVDEAAARTLPALTAPSGVVTIAEDAAPPR
jgi:nucleoside-diphosphate-sugar epimerase